jgi:DNA mismatch repair protein MutS
MAAQTDYSPMMQQYLRIKETVGDAVLLFRVGDFYETFMEDAVTASKVLDITLTKKHVGKSRTVPLAGVPHHAVESYIFRLTRAGYRVALCDQVEDPKLAKRVVKREVTRTITPGTLMESEVLGSDQNNYLAAVSEEDLEGFGFAYIDISTGEYRATAFPGTTSLAELAAEVGKVRPSECLLEGTDGAQSPIARSITQETNTFFTLVEPETFDVKAIHEGPLQVQEPEASEDGKPFPSRSRRLALRAAAAVWHYVRETQRRSLGHVLELQLYRPSDRMLLDAATVRNLELIHNLKDGGRSSTLLQVLQHTVSPLGGRLLRKWIVRPLVRKEAIEARLDAVDELFHAPMLREDARALLDEVHDLERLTGRICFGNANARDMVALAGSLETIPRLKALLERPELARTHVLVGDLDPMVELVEQIRRALVDDPPVSIRDGGMIRSGFSPELDGLRQVASSGKDFIARLQSRERERTGIASLKVGYNQVFGYYLEVTKPNLHLVPAEWVRKQTLVNAERFITEELKEYESKVLGAQERIEELEYTLFVELRDRAATYAARLKSLADRIATLDVIQCFAQAAVRNDYCRPEIDTSSEIEIEAGRHPVLELADLGRLFVPNDAQLAMEQSQILIITGPNMAGKSTYIRQVALITLMAQIGSFVPAKRARIGVVDRIFTRVGASDNLAQGESTFMVEMKETAAILRHATPHSLIVLDEIGRGTSTYDGISIAWAVAEYVHALQKKGVKTLFATHYHELADLQNELPRVKNLRVLVSESGGKITFLYQIRPGASDHSYGIHVAELAGLPPSLLRRARRILKDLENSHAGGYQGKREQYLQLSLFSMLEDPIRARLKKLDLEQTTPAEAIQILADLIGEVDGERK